MTRVHLIAIARDSAIFLGITFAAGFMTGFVTALAHASAEQQHWWLVGTDLLVGTLVIAALATRSHRNASHLVQVGVLVWILGLLGIVLGVYTPIQWGMTAASIAVEVGLGLALARLARQRSVATSKGAT